MSLSVPPFCSRLFRVIEVDSGRSSLLVGCAEALINTNVLKIPQLLLFTCS